MNVQRNKVYAVTVIAAVAQQLTCQRRSVSIDMEPKDGVIWVYGIGEHGIMTFTDEGVDELKKLFEMHRENPDTFK